MDSTFGEDLTLSNKNDDTYQFYTPEKCSPLSPPNVAFFGESIQVDEFISQINSCMSCKSFDCKGKLVLTDYDRARRGGAISMTYRCSGCSQKVTFDSSHSAKYGKNIIMRTIQLAFISAGCYYAKYHRVLHNALGIPPASYMTFRRLIEDLHKPVQELLDEQCKLAKEDMMKLEPFKLGNWRNAVTVGDAVWLTRGFHSRNGTFTVRDYLTGALLYYEHMCQRGKDKVTNKEEYPGTSKSMEGYEADVIIARAKEEGLNITVHVQDGDSNSADSLKQHYPDCEVIYCGGHNAKNFHKHLAKFQTKEKFDKKDLAEIQRCWLDLKEEAEKAECACKTNHKSNCGCFTDFFCQKAGAIFFSFLDNCGKDHVKLSNMFKQWGSYHARDVHSWEGGECSFHSQTKCSCGKCEEDGAHKCEGKPYKTTGVLTCPYHRLCFEIECNKLASVAKALVHPYLGRVHTNQVEASHNVLIRYRSKTENFSRLAYEVTTNLGLLQSNMTWLHNRKGADYHWFPELLKKMGLPVYDGVVDILKRCNKKRIEYLQNCKTREFKKSRKDYKRRRKVIERKERLDWVKKRNDMKKGKVKKPKSKQTLEQIEGYVGNQLVNENAVKSEHSSCEGSVFGDSDSCCSNAEFFEDGYLYDD
jgi:hypothetical protein